MAGLRSRVEAAAGGSEAVKVAKLDHRLCQLEKRLQSSHTTAETEPAEGTGTTAAAPAMTDSEMFRLRMKLISQGYTSAEADQTIAVRILQMPRYSSRGWFRSGHNALRAFSYGCLWLAGLDA